MTFERQVAEKWRDEIPGARWFKANLQVHTIEDHPGGKVKMPADLGWRTDGSAEADGLRSALSPVCRGTRRAGCRADAAFAARGGRLGHERRLAHH